MGLGWPDGKGAAWELLVFRHQECAKFLTFHYETPRFVDGLDSPEMRRWENT